MNSWKIILATILIFGAGIITGGLLVNHVKQDQFNRISTTVTNAVSSATSARQAGVSGMEQKRIEFLRKVSGELGLTAEQKQCVEQILHDSQERIHKIWEPVAPKMREEMTNVNERIMAELTPQQRKCFDQLIKRPQPHKGDETNKPTREVKLPLTPPAGQGQSNVVGGLGTSGEKSQ